MLRKREDEKKNGLSEGSTQSDTRYSTNGQSSGTNSYRNAMVIAFLILFSALNYNMSKTQMSESDLEIFQLRSGRNNPSHLDFIKPLTDLRSIGFQSLDTAHRNGMIHQGASIYLVDSSLSQSTPRILMLKRGRELVTCPNTWSLIGEHTYRDEPSIETVRRALLEELGPVFQDRLNYQGKIRNLTDYPLFYERDYGASNGNRVDRQVTWLWLVEMNFDANENGFEEADQLLQLDDEVADHLWISLDELEVWIDRDEAKLNDFCHHTIVSLYRLGIERMKALAKEQEDGL